MEVGRMRVNRTFSLDYMTVQAIKSKSNQSQFVDTAIQRALKQESAFDIDDFDTIDLVIELRHRKDLPEWFIEQVRILRKELEL